MRAPARHDQVREKGVRLLCPISHFELTKIEQRIRSVNADPHIYKAIPRQIHLYMDETKRRGEDVEVERKAKETIA
jgi:hypothetical protein